MRRTAKLVKPGGLLIIHDIDLASMLRTGGPATVQAISRTMEVFKSREADSEIGKKLGDILTCTGYFTDIHVRKATVPLSGIGAGG